MKTTKKWTKIVSVLLAMVLCVSVFTACGNEPAPAAAPAPAAEPTDAMPTFDNVKISTGSGTAGGTQYVYMGGVANIVNNEVEGLELILEGTSGTGENLSLLQSGDIDIACIESSYAYNAYTGASGEKFDNIRSLFVCMPTVYAAFTVDPSLANIEDFAGRIIAAGPANGSTDISSRAVYNALGLTDSVTVQNAGWSDCLTALTEGQIEGVTGQFLQPNSAVIEAEATADLNFVRLTDEQLGKILDAYPYYSEYMLNGDTYEGLKGEDYKTFASWQAVYGSTDLSDDLAYAITKAVFENLYVLTSTVSTASQTTLENISQQPIPLHPGAYRYYVEKGIDVPAELIPPQA